MRRILIKVWQGKLTPGQALNELQDELARDGPKFKKLRENENCVLYELETLKERAITTTEAEEEVLWMLQNGKTQKKSQQKTCCQT